MLSLNLHCFAAILNARRPNRPIILMLGGHPIKLGLSRFLIYLIDRRFVTHLATNGGGIIHDFELSLLGETSESVPRWLSAGQFGLWQETSRLNDIISEAAARKEGLGEAVPLTSHVTIGADIIHGHPNCDGAALGQTSHTDFLLFALAVQDLEGGVFLNVAHQRGARITNFTTAVFDLAELPENWREAMPGKADPFYYHRGLKTILVRVVADGGTSYFIHGDHRQTIPSLWHLLTTTPLAEDPIRAPHGV